MKLNPPASSSDLDAARAIARRLHRRAHGHERATDVTPGAGDEPTAPAGAAVPVPPVVTMVPEPAPFEPTPPEPAAFEPAPPPVEPPPPEPANADEGPTIEEEPPSGLPETTHQADEAEETPSIEPPPTGPSAGVEEFEASASSPDPWAAQATPAEGITAPPGFDPESAFGDLGAPGGGAPGLGGLEPPPEAASPEDLVGDATGPEWPEGNPLEAQIDSEQGPEVAPDDIVGPPTPSWDDVVDECQALARVHGAMLVDPSGQVLAARGDWPEPGPEAIGGRLVSMMAKTLQDAPTRSVSAPLAGRHLTAWRVPASEGYYTVVFMGDAPLGADVRAPVDVEIKRALGR